jgi:copper(I)-binding protein
VSRVLAPVLARAAAVLATRTTSLLAAGTAALALTACGAAGQPLVYEERNSSSASELTIGQIQLRDVAVEAPEEFAHEAGDTVELSLALFNPTAQDDRLVEVTTDAAASVALLENGRRVEAIDVPAGGALMGDDIGLALVDTTRALAPGTYVEVTMVFEESGAETFLVPVRSRNDELEREYSEQVHPEEEH